MDPKPISTSDYLECILVYLVKVLLAFKRKRFGRAWPGTFWLQAEALWLEGFWIDSSLDGSVLLVSVYIIIFWYVLVKDLYIVWQFTGMQTFNSHINDHEDNVSFQDGRSSNQDKFIKYLYLKVKDYVIDREPRGALRSFYNLFNNHEDSFCLQDGTGSQFEEVLRCFHSKVKDSLVARQPGRGGIKTFCSYLNNRKDNLSFQDGSGRESNEFIKFLYSMLRLQGGNILVGVHRGVGGASGLGGGGGLGGRDYPRGEIGRHALVGDWVWVVELQEGGLVLKLDEGGAVVQLNQIEVHPVHLVGVDQASLAQFCDCILQIAIRLRLEAPDGQTSGLLLGLQRGAQQIIIGATAMVIGESGKNVNELIVRRVSKFATHLATRGDFPLFVILYTLSIRTGGIRIWRCRLMRLMRMSTSFSPGSFLGIAGPAKTKDLRIGNRRVVFGNNVFSPNYISAVEGQEAGVGLLLVVRDGFVDGGLVLSKSLHLATQVFNLLLEFGHVGVVSVDAMVSLGWTGMFRNQGCFGNL